MADRPAASGAAGPLDRDEFAPARGATARPAPGDNLDLADLQARRIDGGTGQVRPDAAPRRALEHLSLLEGYAWEAWKTSVVGC